MIICDKKVYLHGTISFEYILKIPLKKVRGTSPLSHKISPSLLSTVLEGLLI